MSSWREFGREGTHLPSEPLDEEGRAARCLPGPTFADAP